MSSRRVDVSVGLHRIDVTSGRPSPQTEGGVTHVASRVIGFSQTREWFLSRFEAHVVDSRWEAVCPNGASIEKWADPNFNGWTSASLSPVAEPPITRVVLNISGAGRSQAQWTSDIQSAVSTLRSKLPDVTTIYLEPVVGGPSHTVCQIGGTNVRAAENHPTIDLAIADAITADPTLTAGLSPEVGECAHFDDTTGHLTQSGAVYVGDAMGAHYAALDS